jgi:hypothetical protein
MKGLAKLVAFSAVFLACGAFLLGHELEAGALSPRTSGVAFLVLFVANGFGITIGFLWLRKKGRQMPAPQSLASSSEPALEPEIRRQRIRAIRGLKIWIAALMLGLVIGLSQAREHPWWASAVGVTISLVLTATLARFLFRLQKTLK